MTIRDAILLGLCSILFIFNGYAQTITVGGSYSSNQVWTGVDTVRVTSTVTVSSNRKITIGPGVVVDFSNGTSITGEMDIEAIGAPGDSIRFLIDDTTGYASGSAGWDEIFLGRGFFEYCVFEYSTVNALLSSDSLNIKHSRFSHNTGDLITMNNSLNGLNLEHSAFSYNKYGSIRLNNLNSWRPVFIDSNVFHHNIGGEVIYTSDVTQGSISNNTFKFNSGSSYKDNSSSVELIIEGNTFVNNTSGNGGALNLVGSSVTIKGNYFHMNNASKGGALYVSGSGSYPLIIENDFHNNEASNEGGAIYTQTTHADIVYNTILNNSSGGSGGGLYADGSYDLYVNNIVANNEAKYGGGLAQLGANDIEVYNNIIAFNQDTFIAGAFRVSNGIVKNNIVWGNNSINSGDEINVQSGVTVDYNITETVTSANNISVDPVFASEPIAPGISGDGTSADWNVDECSFAGINAGDPGMTLQDLPAKFIYEEDYYTTDLKGHPRITQDTIDIGPYESEGIGSLMTNSYICEQDSFSTTIDAATYGEVTPTLTWQVDTGNGWFTAPFPTATAEDLAINDVDSNAYLSASYRLIGTFSCVSDTSATYMLGNIQSAELVQLDQTICDDDSVFAEGAWQNTPGVYNDTLTKTSGYIGCDSIVELTLNVDPTFMTSTNDTICSNDSIMIGGVYRSTAGIYNDTLSAVTGCDSVVAVDLFVKPVPNVDIGPDTLEACDGQSYMFDVTASGVASYVISDFSTTVNDTSFTVTYDVTQPTTAVQAEVTGTNGCEVKDRVNFVSGMISNLAMNLVNINGNQVSFSPSNIPDNVDMYYWDFGDGDSSAQANPTHVYADGSYTACLIALNDCDSATSCATFSVPSTSIQEWDVEDIELGPNPTNGVVTINNIKRGIFYTVYNGFGAEISSGAVPYKGELKLDLSSEPSGLYMVHFKGRDLHLIRKIMKE